MRQNVVENILCVECLTVLTGEFQKDFRENSLCPSCVESYYTACARCARFTAVDEANAADTSSGEAAFYCPECGSESRKQAELNYTDEEVALLVDEFVALHAEEKRLKEQLEAIKQKLKDVAEAQSGGTKPVTLVGLSGTAGVKCTYRTALKADAGKVAQLEELLGQELFAELFSEKLSFDVNKSNFEKIISEGSDLPEDVRRQIKEAVKITTSATINVA